MKPGRHGKKITGQGNEWIRGNKATKKTGKGEPRIDLEKQRKKKKPENGLSGAEVMYNPMEKSLNGGLEVNNFPLRDWNVGKKIKCEKQ